MKKYNLIDGAIVATTGIVLCKILGLLYVIPFYEMIGTQGGALYSYAYSIYAVFLNLSTGGIPTAVSKIISEYAALECEYAKQRAYKIASNILNFLGILSFIILFCFSEVLAKNIIGDVEGGNTLQDVSIAIKVVSVALLIVPRLSVLRGFFQGNKYLSQSSASSIIEQLVRVGTIIVGSYITVKIFGLPIKLAVYLAIFGATLGAVISYIFLKLKVKKNDFVPLDEETIQIGKKEYTDKFLFKKIMFYAIPFVLIDLLHSAYNVVDTFTIYRTMTSMGYSVVAAETTVGVINTWGTKLNMIIISIAFGLTASLIPNIVDSYVRKDYKDINRKINQSIKLLLYMTIPMAVGISFLSVPIWNVFYGYDALSIDIFKIFILQVVFYGLYTTTINIAQSMNQTKISLGVLIFSFILKAILNVPMMYLCHYIGIGGYYGSILTNVLVQIISFMLILMLLKKKFKFKYKEIVMPTIKISVCILGMLIVLIILKNFLFVTKSSFECLITITIFSVVGSAIYFFLSYKLKLISNIFGDNFIFNIKKKLSRKFSRKKVGDVK